ncbi:hypothetical protein OKHIL_26370 [Mycolicibacterium mageritense]|nr:hypothetical protein MTY414_31740 [Mycolicibacterium mageritense]
MACRTWFERMTAEACRLWWADFAHLPPTGPSDGLRDPEHGTDDQQYHAESGRDRHVDQQPDNKHGYPIINCQLTTGWAPAGRSQWPAR